MTGVQVLNAFWAAIIIFNFVMMATDENKAMRGIYAFSMGLLMALVAIKVFP